MVLDFLEVFCVVPGIVEVSEMRPEIIVHRPKGNHFVIQRSFFNLLLLFIFLTLASSLLILYCLSFNFPISSVALLPSDAGSKNNIDFVC